MRVCFVCGNIYPLLAKRTDIPIVGGAEVQQYLIGKELAQRGVEVSYVTEDFGQGSETVCDNFRVLAYKYGRNKIVQGLTLWQALQQANADVYYVRGFPKFGAILLIYCAVRRRKLVVGMSTNRIVYPRSKAGLSWPYYLMYRLALSISAAVVAQTEFQRTQLAQNYGVHNAVVIRNGAAASSLLSRNVKRKSSIVWMASIRPCKGVEKVFELAERLPDQQIVIGGGRSRSMEAYYEQMRGKAQYFSNIEWRGFIPHDQVDHVIAGALAFINTTVVTHGVPNLEGFPNVYLEAWRNGVPTLTLNNDPDEIICRNGLGYNCNSVEQMAADLRRLASNPTLRQKIGESSKRYFEENNHIKKIAMKYNDLFHGLQ